MCTAAFAALVVALLLAMSACASSEPSLVATATHGRSTIVGFMQNAEPAGWDRASDRIIINRRGANHIWNAYSVLPNKTGLTCITCTRPSFPGVGTATQRGASDVSPHGGYVLLTIEKGSHPGNVGSASSDPGRGVYSDIWLSTLKGEKMWQLTDIPAASNRAIIWPRFDRTGSQIVWSQMYRGIDLRHPLGQWALKIAHLAWNDGTPSLANIRTFEPQTGKFFEPYGFSPNNQRIIFASDIDVHGGLLETAFNSQIWTINASSLGNLQRISPDDPTIGPFSNYNEFAFYIPGSDEVVFGRTYHSKAGGMDYWTANSDGGNYRQLTSMDQPGNRQYMGYADAGGIAFDPKNPHRFIAGVSRGLFNERLQAILVTIH